MLWVQWWMNEFGIIGHYNQIKVKKRVIMRNNKKKSEDFKTS